MELGDKGGGGGRIWDVEVKEMNVLKVSVVEWIGGDVFIFGVFGG